MAAVMEKPQRPFGVGTVGRVADKADVLSGASPAGSGARETSEEPGRTEEARPSDEPVDLLATAGSPVMKRVVPLLVVGIVAILVLRQC